MAGAAGGARLGVPCSAAEQACSLRPQDYTYGAFPSAAVLARLQRQLCTPSEAPSTAGCTAGSLTGAAPGPAAAATATAAAAPAPADAAKLTGMEDAYHPQLHMPELDDDCLRLLLGDDADESAAAAAATQGGTPAAPTPPGSGNASEKSSACHADEPAAAGGDVEAASRQPAPGAHPEDDDDIAMLFGEARHAPSLEALDLHLLGAAPMGAADDTSSEAGAEGGEDGCTREAAAAAGAGLKRQACEGLASPPGRGLMLHMNYEKATESINLELLSGRSKPAACADAVSGFDPALLLSPLPDFPPLGCDTPESPDSFASGSDELVPPPSLAGLLDSGSKRKRAVTAAV